LALSPSSSTNTASKAENDAPYKNTSSRPHYHISPSPTHSIPEPDGRGMIGAIIKILINHQEIKQEGKECSEQKSN
jgi:hypothetical protein